MITQKLTSHRVLRWTDDECRAFLERMRWPNGPHCPKCGENKPYSITRKSRTKNRVQSLYKCRVCKRQYTATVGTIFEDSKIPLHKWFAAIFLMCSSKKGISAHQLHRSLDITYKSAWFMCHRIREASKDKELPKLTGTIEADETYLGGRTRRGHKVHHERSKDEIEMGLRPRPARKPPYQDKTPVFGMVERDGTVRTMVVPDATGKTLRPIMTNMIDLQEARLITDGHPAYRRILKRGVYGVFHHVGDGYLPMYLAEFEYRFNHRKMTDAERFAALMSQTQGRLHWYCQTPQPQNLHA